MSKTETTVRANFDGIRFTDGAAHLFYSKLATNAVGNKRPVSAAVLILPDDVARIEKEFVVGDLIEVTEETDWSLDSLPVVLKSIVKLNTPAAQAA